MSIAQEIESHIDIVDLVREYVPLKKAGVNFKGLSPFVTEKTPSFIVSPAKQIAYCFSSQQGGGPIKFLMLIERIPFGEALQILAKRAGVELKTNYYKEQTKEGVNLYDMHKIAANHYHKLLLLPDNKDKVEYLKKRGLTEETIKEFQIGYSDQPKDLFYELKEKGFEEKDIIASGIFVSANRDKFFGRIIFPIKNYRGDVVAFTGRVMWDGQPKYLNSPESSIFHKSDILFGISKGKRSIAQKKRVIIVEGQMDVIALHQAGFDEAVGISGTALTESHIRQLRRLQPVVYLCLDNDSAGIKATFASIDNLVNQDMDIHIVDLGKYKDPDEVLTGGGDFEKLLSEAPSHIGFFLDKWGKKYDINTVQGKKKLITGVLEHIATMNSNIEVDLYLREMSQKIGVSLDVLYDEYYKIKKSGKIVEPESKKYSKEEPQTQKKMSISQELLIVLLQSNMREKFLQEFVFKIDDLLYLDDVADLVSFLKNNTIDENQKKILEFLQENDTVEHNTAHDRSLEVLMRQIQKDIYKRKKQKLLDKVKSGDTQAEAEILSLNGLAKTHNLI